MKINVLKLQMELGAKDNFLFTMTDLPNVGEVVITKPIEVEGQLVNTGNSLELSMKIKTEVAVSCSRCLDEVNLPIEFESVDQYCHKSDKDDVLEDSGDELSTVMILEDDWIDIERAVQENIILNMPMYALCRPDCPGICPQCGKNLKEGKCDCCEENLDPRFEALARLKEKMKAE
ncbi:MAG: DUF177 domain-containing protein [Clostridia bacterium]|nr:DUF177 domain-containing protein [Clostridia bacterium]MDD4048536.1 DUF177 domain-containing protein [Clostridia bacterium]